MKWHEFIFSNQPLHRRLRHGIFWLLWWWYFFCTVYWLQSPYNKSGLWETSPWKWSNANFFISLWMVLIHMLACYAVIGFLLPRYLLKASYFKFMLGILLLILAMAVTCHFMYEKIFPLGETNFISFQASEGIKNNTWWASISAGPLSAVKIITAAVAIKLLKRWWLKQKESQQLEREKINAELQLLKAQIHPGFLFTTLNNIYGYALTGSPRASEMLLKLSDLLSYMLYECDRTFVPLEKEIEMMKDYMALEKTRLDDGVEMEILVKGDTGNRLIAPFLLLPFIENSFKHCAEMVEKCWINLEIKLVDHFCQVKLINGMAPEILQQSDSNENGLANVKMRLNLLYPGKHELKVNRVQEMLVVLLKIELSETPHLPNDLENTINNTNIPNQQTHTYAEQ